MKQARELTPQEEVIELQDEFMLESAEYRLAAPGSPTRNRVVIHINAILDRYLDMWPELAYEAPDGQLHA